MLLSTQIADLFFIFAPLSGPPKTFERMHGNCTCGQDSIVVYDEGLEDCEVGRVHANDCVGNVLRQ